jgi:hypothetical protein
MIWYRFEDYEGEVIERRFETIKTTPKGEWVKPVGQPGNKMFALYALAHPKKYCHSSRAAALEAYMLRTLRLVEKWEDQIRYTKRMREKAAALHAAAQLEDASPK